MPASDMKGKIVSQPESSFLLCLKSILLAYYDKVAAFPASALTSIARLDCFRSAPSRFVYMEMLPYYSAGCFSLWGIGASTHLWAPQRDHQPPRADGRPECGLRRRRKAVRSKNGAEAGCDSGSWTGERTGSSRTGKGVCRGRSRDGPAQARHMDFSARSTPICNSFTRPTVTSPHPR
jgi:hypothetical protein